MRVHVEHSIGDLADDLKGIATSTPRRMAGVVRDAAQRGNRNAKAFASEQHTMFSDVDADYAPSFTVEQIAPLVYEYGPDAALPEGSKASGYEFGSVNQASPHRNLDRSVDIERTEFPMDVSDEMRLIWQQAGF
ncbi:hypothetical protein [Nocardioides nitrophenolicus]|uniref:hypothetical protein n=1 Tax=Nocardioides nitrophenolicus TaxID=60489 RepID=UPI00195A352F|nr:hypothetical protein [Nocardioides nitrophenolicus]MBM7518275.1 hypothetical protein [Nocardioides nitrophenolicus]